MTEPNYERELLARAAASSYPSEMHKLTAPVSQRIAEIEGIDFATALIYDRITRSPQHGPFIEALESQAPTTRNTQIAATLVIVPGGFYKELRRSGADGQVLREAADRVGMRSELVPLKSFGSLTENARILGEWLMARSEEPLVIASLSKAGAEVKIALAQPNAAEVFRNVRWWLNFSGVVDGTPLADWLLARRFRTLGCRLLCWLRGYDFDAVRELAGGVGSPLGAAMRLPALLRAIHVVGFPLAHQVTPGPIRRGFNRLRHLGPTDGAGILLANAGRWPGSLYPVWGADHYLRPRGQNGSELAMRLLQYVVQHEHEASSDELSCDAVGRWTDARKPEVVQRLSQGIQL